MTTVQAPRRRRTRRSSAPARPGFLRSDRLLHPAARFISCLTVALLIFSLLTPLTANLAMAEDAAAGGEEPAVVGGDLERRGDLVTGRCETERASRQRRAIHRLRERHDNGGRGTHIGRTVLVHPSTGRRSTGDSTRDGVGAPSVRSSRSSRDLYRPVKGFASDVPIHQRVLSPTFRARIRRASRASAGSKSISSASMLKRSPGMKSRHSCSPAPAATPR